MLDVARVLLLAVHWLLAAALLVRGGCGLRCCRLAGEVLAVLAVLAVAVLVAATCCLAGVLLGRRWLAGRRRGRHHRHRTSRRWNRSGSSHKKDGDAAKRTGDHNHIQPQQG